MNSESQTREQWLAERQTGIGGSDAAAACGLSKWKTRYRLWLEKRGMLPPSDETEPMRWGTKLEPIVRQEYADQTGREIVTPTAMIRHPSYPQLLANLDGIASEGRGYEGKTSRTSDGWGEPGTNEIPDEYTLQVQHYMLVTGLPVFDVAVLIGGSDFRIYEVEADTELHEMLLEQELAFWRLVESGEEPEAESPEDTRVRWPASQPKSIVASEAVIEAARKLAAIKQRKAEVEAEEARLAAFVQQAMRDSEAISTPDGKIIATWKSAKATERFDGKAFAAEHPELHGKYLRRGESSRRFLLKEFA